LNIEEGDRILVGGNLVFSSGKDKHAVADFERLEPFLKETKELAASYQLPELRKWLEGEHIAFDEKLFAALFAFTKKYEVAYPEASEKKDVRKSLYARANEDVLLSEVFEANAAECAEIAALAQAYLQQEGIHSSYFSGDVLWNRGQEFSGAHSFVVIRENNETCIFDPTNPTNTSIGKCPSIYKAEKFDEEMEEDKKRFLAVHNLIAKSEVLYGMNLSDGSNVSAEDIVNWPCVPRRHTQMAKSPPRCYSF
jgi:hypothetical protein